MTLIAFIITAVKFKLAKISIGIFFGDVLVNLWCNHLL